PAKIRPIFHEGTYFKVEGPHLPSPSRQRTPVLFSATASGDGTKFAGKHTEVVFTGGPTAGFLKQTIANIRTAAGAAGRRADDVKFVTQAGVIVGRTEDEARAKRAEYERLSDPEGYLAHAGLTFDPTAFPPETPLQDVVGEDGNVGRRRVFDPGQTVGEFLAGFGDISRHPLFVSGTPGVVADAIEGWLDDVGIDGINLTQHHSYGTARDFVELVVPVLRERGRLRSEYDPDESLRDRIFGAGDRLPDRHYATRYRGGAFLPAAGRRSALTA
ncbi:MAG TPA: LLM class flavin-dependent oxidoreductase, partial [Trebonia sp.]|nr:LLM class flavin-dependent oxidoreductase [Trebonia sp.]